MHYKSLELMLEHWTNWPTKKEKQEEGHHELMFKINFGNPTKEVMLAQLGAQQNAFFNQSQKRWTSCKYGDAWCLKPIWNYNDQNESEYIQL
jgi:hypothetical protein